MAVPTAARIDFALGSLIGVCLFALASCGGDSSHATPKPGAQPPAGWRTFGDARMRFSIAYPEDWTVDSNYVYPMRIEGRELHGVSFSVPEAMRAHTNLAADTRLSVESVSGVTVCEARRFVDTPENELTENDNGHTWSVADAGDAGAGNFYDETVYALEGSSPCLAIRYFIHSTNIANYDPGAVKQFDRGALVTMFGRIRSTLALTPSKDTPTD
jgi:hypothetical protein